MKTDILEKISKLKESFLWPKIIKGEKKLKILFVSTEAAPFAKAGGLGDVMFSLPLALNNLGQDTRLLIPKYGGMNFKKFKLRMKVKGLKVPTDQPAPTPQYLICNIKEYTGNQAVHTYFLENMEYYEKRANIYGYSDDFIRWILLNRGTIEFIKQSLWKPDIIVSSDWQTSLIPNYIKTNYRKDKQLKQIVTILTIHNLRYQGMKDFRFTPETKRDSGTEPIPDFFNPRLGELNWLLRGIIYSDFVVTVSPTYAKEILTPEYGEGLDKILSENQGKIVGILNGINTEKFNPQKDPLIPFHYSSKNISNKLKDKLALQKKFGLEQNPNKFILSIVSRLTEQKGLDLVNNIIDSLLQNLPLQLIIVGDGEARYKEKMKAAKKKFPEKISYHLEFNTSLPHLVFSGADAILIPSKFEPCGITQMQAMEYGTIPIARKTGGLADTIRDFNPSDNSGNGFIFDKYDSEALLITIIRAYTSFQFKKVWEKLVKKDMREDFSWKNSAKKYLNLFYHAWQTKNK